VRAFDQTRETKDTSPDCQIRGEACLYEFWSQMTIQWFVRGFVPF
jgi:hypothetical protein